MTNKERAKKAIDFVLEFEKSQDRDAQDVSSSRDHRGYDIKSDNRMIEVKGVGESWTTYTWQSLHCTEVESLKLHPNDFYLYLVKFKDCGSDEIDGLYIIPGTDLSNEAKFRLKIENYALRPISKASLSKYEVKTKAASLR